MSSYFDDEFEENDSGDDGGNIIIDDSDHGDDIADNDNDVSFVLKQIKQSNQIEEDDIIAEPDDIVIDDQQNEDDDEQQNSNISDDDAASLINDDDTSDDEYDEDDDEYDENYLKKFEKNIDKQYIHDFHTECKRFNADEVKQMCNITRDSSGVINDKFHKTLPVLSKYERARVIGQRSVQINNGAKIFIDVDKNITDGFIIANMELDAKKNPFIIRRPIPNGGSEFWRVSNLENILY